MVKQIDLLIIGGGMGGTMAALTAAQSGLHTMLVRKGYGATAISSGAVDLAGCKDWLHRVQGVEADVEPVLKEAVASFLEMMEEAGCPYTGEAQRSLRLINNLGTIKDTQLCPCSMEAGDMLHLNGAHVLFVGFHGFADFDANYISRSVSFYSKNRLVDTQLTTAALEIPFPHIKRSANLSPFDLARLLDQETVAVELCDSLSQAADLPAFTHLAFPPVLGLNASGKTLEVFRSQLGRPCFEILTAPPSVPGLRLQKALDRLLHRAGISQLHGQVISYRAAADQIQEITIQDKSVRHDLLPRLVVLSSGKFISGGIQWNQALREPIFDLPVCVDGDFDLPSGMSLLLSDQFVGDQRLFSAGLKVDRQMRPLAPSGKPVYTNLLAAGSVISGYNYSQGQGGLGIPLVSGLISGKVAAEQLSVEGVYV